MYKEWMDLKKKGEGARERMCMWVCGMAPHPYFNMIRGYIYYAYNELDEVGRFNLDYIHRFLISFDGFES